MRIRYWLWLPLVGLTLLTWGCASPSGASVPTAGSDASNAMTPSLQPTVMAQVPATTTEVVPLTAAPNEPAHSGAVAVSATARPSPPPTTAAVATPADAPLAPVAPLFRGIPQGVTAEGYFTLGDPAASVTLTDYSDFI